MRLAKTPSRFGALAGAAVIRADGEEHDLRHEIWVDGHHSEFSTVHHDSQFILLVEKRSIFDRLVQDQFPLTCPCLLATGSGYPARQFRALIRDIHAQLRVPLYVLVDNDPAGYLLFFLIARGTAKLGAPAKPSAAIPTVRFIGLRSEDFERLSLSRSSTIDLGPREHCELERLRDCPWLKSDPAWAAELALVHRHGFKIELEALCSIETGFLAKEYLPARIGSREYLELLP